MGVGRMAAASVVVAVACLGVMALSSADAAQHKPTASELLGRDPGKRVDGNTIVVTGNGEKVLGVPDRPNFIIALGSGEKITGGAKNNELGALGENDTIVADRSHELIVAGPHGKVIVRGSGHDLVVDTKPGSTIELESSHDEVIDTGHNDHILCTRGALHDTIYDNHSDTVNRTCHKDHDQVRPVTKSVLARDFAPPVAHPAAVSGDGSNSNPYTEIGTCSWSVNSCTVSFDSRTLSGLWTNEQVPAYACPAPDSFLSATDFAPFGTTVPGGVEVNGLGPIGIYIPRTRDVPSNLGYTPGGTLRDSSSATNWTIGSASYQVVLHCTSNAPFGYGSP